MAILPQSEKRVNAMKQEPKKQTYSEKQAIEWLNDGYEVFIAHPMDCDDDEKVTSIADIKDASGHLFIAL